MTATNGFTDGLMLRYLVPDHVKSLLVPGTDPQHERVRSLLTSVYDPASLDIRSVESVEVVHKEFQTAVHASIAVHGSWDKTIPTAEQARATVEVPATPPVHWIDMSLETVVVVKAASAGGLLASVEAEAGWTTADGAAARQDAYERPYRLRYAEPPPSNRRRPPAASPCGSRRSSSTASTSPTRCADSARPSGRSTRRARSRRPTTAAPRSPPAHGSRSSRPSRPTSRHGRPSNWPAPCWRPRGTSPPSRRRPEGPAGPGRAQAPRRPGAHTVRSSRCRSTTSLSQRAVNCSRPPPGPSGTSSSSAREPWGGAPPPRRPSPTRARP